MKPAAFTILLSSVCACAGCASTTKRLPEVTAAAPVAAKVEPGYAHDSDPAAVIVEMWATSTEPPYSRGEPVRFPVAIQRGARYPAAASFIPREEFARAEKELAKRKLRLIDLRLSGPTAVCRGDEKTIVAKSDRRLFWPQGFQLRDGDIIRIFEVME
jgi:hypothetical protein